ncbi:NAD(P)H-binding protein [Streptomyces sp. NBC_00193]|uniref:NAD(P)H-binding protein n=1 Tax=unclassified Streptomyces TaxID=2593676 RepID=UPI0022525566|nr:MULTISPECIES: NAD(P)H-binding protein [unclassified Streptomyces]MCX5123462.1 NAD(P)H-binding protein [Streptomyces sp. NBC_00347]MCX5296810.1 NAD(P)H-binding protein [Streptomyces sp. NBC_00193]
MLLITGASGGLGSLVAQRLADRPDVRIGTRRPTGPSRVRVDFDAPQTLDFRGVDTLLLISAGYGEDDEVIRRHEAAIAAAERDGVRHVVYTSLTAEGDHLPYALAHRWTERRLAASSSLAWTVLRNGLYAELLAALAAPGPDGRITAPLGRGRLAAVSREDLADVAVRVALDPAAHAGRMYELVGDRPLSGADLAAATGSVYAPATLAEARAALSAPGTAPFQPPMLVGTYSAIAAGFLATPDQGPLRTLLPHPPRPALETYKASLPQQLQPSGT